MSWTSSRQPKDTTSKTYRQALSEGKIASVTEVANASEILVMADSLGATKLKAATKFWISRNIYAITRRAGWISLRVKQPGLVGFDH